MSDYHPRWIEAQLKDALSDTPVVGELRRISAGMLRTPKIFHYRSAGGVEVDFVVEDARGTCVGIEVKASASLGERHFAGLRDLQSALGARLRCGVVLYGGDQHLRFSDRLWALPLLAQ